MIRAGQSISLFSRENPSRIQRVENGARIEDELLKKGAKRRKKAQSEASLRK
jgi:hypothetical protein